MNTEIKENRETNKQYKNISYQSNCLGKPYFSKIIMAVCLLYIVQDFFTHEKFFKASAQFTIEIQKNDAQSWINFNQFVSLFCVIVIGIVLKLFYNDLRPFMADQKIIAYECQTEYGNPSGHSLLNMLAFILFLYMYDNNFYEFKQDGNQDKISLIKIGVFIVNIIWIMMIGFSRIYLGMHSLNQVILGFVYGILFAVIYIEYMNTFINITQLRFICYSKIEKQKLLIRVIIAYIIVIGSTVVIYELVRGLEKDENIKIAQKAIEAGCKKYSKPSEYNAKFLYNKCFVDSGVISGSFGILIAILMSNGVYKGVQVFKRGFASISKKMLLIRSLLMIIPGGLVWLVTYILYIFAFPNNIYLKYILYQNFGIFMMAFIFVYFTPIFFERFGYAIEGDYLQIDSTYIQQNIFDLQSQDSINSTQGDQIIIFQQSNDQINQKLLDDNQELVSENMGEQIQKNSRSQSNISE